MRTALVDATCAVAVSLSLRAASRGRYVRHAVQGANVAEARNHRNARHAFYSIQLFHLVDASCPTDRSLRWVQQLLQSCLESGGSSCLNMRVCGVVCGAFRRLRRLPSILVSNKSKQAKGVIAEQVAKQATPPDGGAVSIRLGSASTAWLSFSLNSRPTVDCLVPARTTLASTSSMVVGDGAAVSLLQKSTRLARGQRAGSSLVSRRAFLQFCCALIRTR